MRRKFDFGRYNIDGYDKNYNITVEIELKQNEKRQYIFSASGGVYRYNNEIMWGQCLDEISKYVKNSTFKEIYRLWKLYHLNDMNAGTKEQSEAIEKALKDGILEDYDYTKVCEYLKSINLYEVEYQGKPYKYGHSWLLYEIPTKDIKKIKNLLEKGDI